MRQVVTLFCAIILATPAWIAGQSHTKITGVVLDSLNGDPVEQVAIAVPGLQIGTYTDTRGRFELANLYQGTYTLRVSHIAYQIKTREIAVTADTPVHLFIRLTPKTYQSDPVIIEEAITAAGVISITRQEIESSHAHTLDELLSQVAEVTVVPQSGSGAQGVRIRGSNIDQVLVLLDDVPLNDPLTGEADLSQIPLDLLERIEIHTRGNSAEYGPGAFAGVLNLHSRSQPLHQFSIDGHLGSFGDGQASTTAGGEVSGWSYLLSGQYRHDDNRYPYVYHRPDGTPVHTKRQNAQFQLQAIHGALTMESPSRTVRIRSNYLTSRRGIPGKVYQWTPYASAADQRFDASVSLTNRWNKSHFILRSSYGTSTSVYRNDLPEDAPLKYRAVPSYFSEYVHDAFRNQATFHYEITPLIRANAAFDYRSTGFEQREVSSDYAVPVDARQTDYGLGIGGDLTIPLGSETSYFTTGPSVRYSRVALKNTAEPQRYPFFSYTVTGAIHQDGRWNASLYLDYNRSFRPPTFGDLFYQDFRVTGNPDLRPEKSREWSLGTRISPPGPITASLESEIYRKAVEDQIIWLTGSFGNFTPENTTSHITGGSVRLSWDLPDNRCFGQWYVEYLTALDKTPNHAVHNRQLPYRPRFRWQGHLGVSRGPIRLTYYHRYQGIRYTTRANTKYLLPYHVGDVMLSATFQFEKVFPRISIQAALQVKNLWEAEYRIMHRMPEPGRSVELSLRLTYAKKAVFRGNTAGEQ